MRAADEADAQAGAHLAHVLGELHTLRFQVDHQRIKPLHRQPEVIEPLIWRHRRRIDAVSDAHRRQENAVSAKPYIDTRRRRHDLRAQHLGEPPRGCLGVRRANVDVIPCQLRLCIGHLVALPMLLRES